MRPSVQSPEERSLAQLFSDLTSESADLVRKEIQLARAEFSEAIAELKSGVLAMTLSAPLLFAGFLVLLAAAVLGLDVVLQRTWLSALIVGAVVTIAGAIALFAGRRGVRKVEIKPERTISSLRDDREMVRSHVSSDGH